MGLENAFLRVYEAKGSDIGAKLGDLKMKFNPKEYSIQKSASWEVKPAKGAKEAPTPEFKGSDARSMTVEVFLDASAKPKAGDPSPTDALAHDVDTLFMCCRPTPESIGRHKPAPPLVVFGWGTTTLFTAFVKQVSVKYTLFTPEGKPIRATASVTLQEAPGTESKQNPTSGALAAHGTHTVVAGDSLASIAYAEYGDARLWRAVADANRLDDPMRLRAGTRLLIPPAEAAALQA